jgi:hypothetical protein
MCLWGLPWDILSISRNGGNYEQSGFFEKIDARGKAVIAFGQRQSVFAQSYRKENRERQTKSGTQKTIDLFDNSVSCLTSLAFFRAKANFCPAKRRLLYGSCSKTEVFEQLQ